jgi:hypothetical protein
VKTETAPTAVLAYERRLRTERGWAMDEGDRHFRRESDVFKTLASIAQQLESWGVSYAVAGSMAFFRHGFRRVTEDVDILVTREGLKVIHEHLEELGCVPLVTGSKNLRDAERGVRIEFLVTGAYPGDGKPKPVAVPDPADVGVEIEGIRYLSLPMLVELKLASGMTNPGRLKDLADAQEAIRTFSLAERFAEALNPYVRDKYRELWRGVQEGPAEPWT